MHILKVWVQCLHAASAVVNCVVELILPTGFIRYSPEYVFALSAFGTAILTKVSHAYLKLPLRIIPNVELVSSS